MTNLKRTQPDNPLRIFWLARCLFVFGLVAFLNVLNLYGIAGLGEDGMSAGLIRASLWAATPIVRVQQAIPLAVGDLLLAIFLVSLAEAAVVLLLWLAISKASGRKATSPT